MLHVVISNITDQKLSLTAHLLMLLSSSLIIVVRSSRLRICCSFSSLRARATKLERGMAISMTATPTNAGHPSRLCSDMKAKTIFTDERDKSATVTYNMNFQLGGDNTPGMDH